MASNKEHQLEIYPLDVDHHIGTIRIEKDNGDHVSREVGTVIILDGSMGSNTSRFVNVIIPRVMSLLSYDESQKIQLITFGTDSHHYCKTAEEFKSLKVHCGSGRNLAPAVIKLHEVIQSTSSTFNWFNPIRVLTISHGEILDESASDEAIEALVEFFESSHYIINSQAVRLFTSTSSQPDTRALCSLLQINNTTTSQIVDIKKEELNDDIAANIAKLFKYDNFPKLKQLRCPESIMLQFPWDSIPRCALLTSPGELYVFWLKNVPISEISATIDDIPVKVIPQKQITLTSFQDIMKGTLVYVLDHIKLLKVLNTAEANDRGNKILNYFETTEDKLVEKGSDGEKQISVVLEEITNDKNFKNLNSKQTVELLRTLSKQHKDAVDQRKKDKEAAAQKKRKEEEEAEINRKEEEAAEIKRKEEEAAEKKRQEDEAAAVAAEKKRKEEEEADIKRKEEEAAEIKRKEEEAAEKKRQEDEVAAVAAASGGLWFLAPLANKI